MTQKISNPEDWQRVDDIVIRYQTGDHTAAQELLESFGPFVHKYVNLLNGNINVHDKDTRKFIALFIDDQEIRRKLRYPRLSKTTKLETEKVARQLNIIYQSIPREDITQELSMYILILAKRFKKQSPKKYFCGYLYNAYRYDVFRYVQRCMKEPLVYRAGINVDYNDYAYRDELEAMAASQLEPGLLDLDTGWITGLTCGPEFEKLSDLQRLIMVEYYVNGLKTNDIAEKLSMHRNTVSLNRARAIALIQDELGTSYQVRLRKRNEY